MSKPLNWDVQSGKHLLLLRWIDGNMDGLVQETEITVETNK